MREFIYWNRWLPLGATLATLFVFAGVAGTFSLRWRSDLREGVLRREAESLHAVLALQHLLQSNTAGARLADFGIGDGTEDLFAAVLQSSRLRDVMKVQWFDADGNLLRSLPASPRADPLDATLLDRALLDGSVARFHREAQLREVIDNLPSDHASKTIPLMEVAVALRDRTNDAIIGVAHYWMDGARVDAELAALDRGLWWKIGIIVLVGAGGIAAVSGLALQRLAAINQKLRRQSDDLARANRELVLAAKSSAVGAISAHLIHGLKNPLAGLEGFVADGSAANAAPPEGAAWREAAETARRLRTLVNDVVAVLRDESSGEGERIALRDMLDEVMLKYSLEAERSEIRLASRIPDLPDLTIDSRTANLASFVLLNLVGNALEASPPHSTITLRARIDGALIHFEVADQGPGLPPAVRRQLFRPLLSTKPGHSGIGLAISHQLARHLGGQLELVDTSEGGTVFSFVVPLASDDARATALTVESAASFSHC